MKWVTAAILPFQSPVYKSGLLGGRGLQTELNRIAETADTNSPEVVQVLQEASLAFTPSGILRIWCTTQQAHSSAEAEFNRLALGERNKFTEETLSNVNNQLKSATPGALPAAQRVVRTNHASDHQKGLENHPSGCNSGQSATAAINNADDLRQALRQIGGIPSEKLLAIGPWTPQAEGDTTAADDSEYADLKLV